MYVQPYRGESVIVGSAVHVVETDSFAPCDDERRLLVVLLHLGKRVPYMLEVQLGEPFVGR
ncbi:hypothetical protein PCURB6_23590 [Paenibacillus curdlanolyticus]|nr:hypothetical protein PCURB6_23590 [Paenibacillus curdlanolyticus]